jgi:hypothetical protein
MKGWCGKVKKSIQTEMAIQAATVTGNLSGMSQAIHPPTRGGICCNKGEEAQGDVHEYAAHPKGSVGEEYTKEVRISMVAR